MIKIIKLRKVRKNIARGALKVLAGNMARGGYALAEDTGILLENLAIASAGFILGVLYGLYFKKTGKLGALVYGFLLALAALFIARIPILAGVAVILLIITLVITLTVLLARALYRWILRPKSLS